MFTGRMGSFSLSILLLTTILSGGLAKLKYGPIAEKNHNDPTPMIGCDPDYGWSDGSGGVGMSWFNAMECCYYNKGYPAEPMNQAEQDKIMEYIQVADGGSLGLTAWWLGGNDLHREGSWVWPSGQPFTFTNWVEGEPNDSNGEEDCIAIDSPKEYKWMDLNCTEPMHGAVTHFAVCERIPA